MELVSYISISILCYFIAGIIHELGHVLIGLMYGWKFYLLVIGPLGIRSEEDGKIRFYFEKQVVMWGGVGGTVPKYKAKDNIKVWSRILLGGPLASIMMGIVSLTLGIIAESMILQLLAAMALGMGIVCILPLPLKTGIMYTDGGRWIRLHKGGQEADEELAMFKLTENQTIGVGLSEDDLSSIDALVRSKDAGIRYYGYYSKFQYYKSISNKEEMEIAINKMEEMKSKVPSIIVKDCKVEV